MRFKTVVLSFGLAFLAATFSTHSRAEQPKEKEWTFLVFLNGNNNLDSFGAMNINQMEEVGSTDDINVVVQWASYQRKTVQRLYVQKDNDTRKVTSPVIQDMGKVDMGDYRNLVEFVRWASVNYPAKRYFIDIWDHGSGWHSLAAAKARQQRGGVYSPLDISWDDFSGNHMTNAQLGLALSESAKIIGHKVDLYASDACLMAMAEVAGEMANTVQVFAGSQDLEPGAGWPYQTFLKAWSADSKAGPAQVAKYLTDEYVKSYQGGVNGSDDVTFSAFDMDKYPALTTAVTALGASLAVLSAADHKAVLNAVSNSQYFYHSDYIDLADFIRNLESARTAVASEAITQVKAAIKDFVVANGVTPGFAKATGLSIWLPNTQWTYDRYVNSYKETGFHKATLWGDALSAVLKDGSNAPALY